MEEIAGWIAPFATTVAAMMTAANLGARVTGWGFVVFLIGSLAWSAVGMATGQTNLLLTNGFLCVVNIIGIWRWLGRQASYEKGGQQAAESGPLMPLGRLIGAPVLDASGEKLGEVVEAMAECDGLRLNYAVVSVGGVGGVGETLHAIPRDALAVGDTVSTRLTADRVRALPTLEKDQWPAVVEPIR